jgi:hypothetical protein
MFTALGKGVVKVLASIFAGVGAGFGTVAYFALRDPELWDVDRFNHNGPPIGPTMAALAIGFGTAALVLGLLFWESWKPKQFTE